MKQNLTLAQKDEAINYVTACIGQKLKADKVKCLKHGTTVANALCMVADEKTKRAHIRIDAEALCCPSFQLITQLYLKRN